MPVTEQDRAIIEINAAPVRALVGIEVVHFEDRTDRSGLQRFIRHQNLGDGPIEFGDCRIEAEDPQWTMHRVIRLPLVRPALRGARDIGTDGEVATLDRVLPIRIHGLSRAPGGQRLRAGEPGLRAARQGCPAG